MVAGVVVVRALDLFCGGGGAARGLIAAGFEVVGVDIANHAKNYPGHFIQGDALNPPVRLEDFDFVWASPPCQAYSTAMKHLSNGVPKLIDCVRRMLEGCGCLWVIENVVGAPLRSPTVLCGTQFGMRVHRHRLFEAPWLFALMPDCDKSGEILNPHRSTSRERFYEKHGRQDPEKYWAKEMGVEGLTRKEVRESIPPAYAEFIAKAAIQAGCGNWSDRQEPRP